MQLFVTSCELVLSLDLMRGAFQEIPLQLMQRCHSTAWLPLEEHFYQNLSVPRCHIQWVINPGVKVFLVISTVNSFVFTPTGIWSFYLINLQLLEHITFVDTPGVLSGEKQRTQRSYDFTGVTSWFAAKCDLILLLFDPHKLDISDEFKRVIASLRGNEDKIRVVLNKADQVDTQQVGFTTIIHLLFIPLPIYLSSLESIGIIFTCFFLFFYSWWGSMVHWCGLLGKFWILLRLCEFILGKILFSEVSMFILEFLRLFSVLRNWALELELERPFLILFSYITETLKFYVIPGTGLQTRGRGFELTDDRMKTIRIPHG